MAREVILVCTNNTDVDYQAGYDYIGIDAGSMYLLNNHIPMKMAIGDFDSITSNELDLLTQSGAQIIQLNPIKDETDCEYALNYLKNKYDIIHIYGAIGGRLDHFLALYHLINKIDHSIIIHDQQNDIYVLNQGQHTIHKKRKYLSIFTLKSAQITIEQVQYPLIKRVITVDDTYLVSNEIIGDSTDINVHYGKIIIVQSDDNKNND